MHAVGWLKFEDERLHLWGMHILARKYLSLDFLSPPFTVNDQRPNKRIDMREWGLIEVNK